MSSAYFDFGPDVIRRWGGADCHLLTAALAYETGWPISTLHDTRQPGNGGWLERFGAVLHSGVLAPDGRFVDLTGIHDAEGQRDLIRIHSGRLYITDDFPVMFRPGLEAEIDDLGPLLRRPAPDVDEGLKEAMRFVLARLLPAIRAELAPKPEIEPSPF